MITSDYWCATKQNWFIYNGSNCKNQKVGHILSISYTYHIFGGNIFYPTKFYIPIIFGNMVITTFFKNFYVILQQSCFSIIYDIIIYNNNFFDLKLLILNYIVLSRLNKLLQLTKYMLFSNDIQPNEWYYIVIDELKTNKES